MALSSIFEVSLWDLKQAYYMFYIFCYAIWSIPMGFETFCSFCWGLVYVFIWSIPMGFETWSLMIFIFEWIWFEVSLWDLKPGMSSPVSFACLIWSIPMGFETEQRYDTKIKKNGFEVSLWDLKPQAIGIKFNSVKHLKYPYGIWNRV